MYTYRVIQKSGRNLKMNNSKTNKDKKMQFAPKRWKRSRILWGSEKTVGFLIQNNAKKQTMQQVMIVDSYMHGNAVHGSLFLQNVCNAQHLRRISLSVDTLITHDLQDFPICHPVRFGCWDYWSQKCIATNRHH